MYIYQKANMIIEKGKNNKILHKKSLKIKEVNNDIKKLAKDMIETMTKNDGTGLAAPQVGKNIRIFVIPKELSPACRRGKKKQVFINPEIIKTSKKIEEMEEGCLSLPNTFITIKRAKSIKMNALDENNKEFSLKANGLLARVIQHENDHLNGILITDHEKN